MLPAPDELVVNVAAHPNERADAMAVRVTVFVEEQNVPMEEEADQYDDTAIHFVCIVRSNSKVLGTARLIRKENNSAKIGRVAVLSEYRKIGVGTMIMKRAEEEAFNLNISSLSLEAQQHAIPFYEKLGYEAVGPIFMDAGIPHKLMIKELTQEYPRQ